MRPSLGPVNRMRKAKQVVLILIFAILFWWGYRYIHCLNTPDPGVPPVEGARPVMPETSRYRVEDPLLEIKLSRDRERSREMERIQVLLDRITLSAEVRKEAEHELWRLTRAAAREKEVESLLAANGYGNSLATMNPELITIIIADKIRPDEVKLVGQLAAEATSYSLDRIRIVGKDQ